MKKVILAAVLAIAATTSIAGEYVGIEAGVITNQLTNNLRTNFTTVTYGQRFESVDVEGRMTTTKTETATSNTFTNGSAMDIRAKYTFDSVLGVKPFVRGTIGEQFSVPGKYNTEFWAIEPGVAYRVSPSVFAEVSGSRQEYFDQTLSSSANTVYAVKVGYAIDPKNFIGVKYGKFVFGQEAVVAGVQFVHSM